jgi:hypothetical protein
MFSNIFKAKGQFALVCLGGISGPFIEINSRYNMLMFPVDFSFPDMSPVLNCK